MIKQVIKWSIPIVLFLFVGGWCAREFSYWSCYQDTPCIVVGKSTNLDSAPKTTSVHTDYILILRIEGTNHIVDKQVGADTWFMFDVGDRGVFGVAPSEYQQEKYPTVIGVLIILIGLLFHCVVFATAIALIVGIGIFLWRLWCNIFNNTNSESPSK